MESPAASLSPIGSSLPMMQVVPSVTPVLSSQAAMVASVPSLTPAALSALGNDISRYHFGLGLLFLYLWYCSGKKQKSARWTAEEVRLAQFLVLCRNINGLFRMNC